MKLNDSFLLLFLGISFPVFVVCLIAILLGGAVLDWISFTEAFDALQGVVPVFITYVAAILGFSFQESPALAFATKSRSEISMVQRRVRFWVSMIGPSSLMLFDLALALLFVSGLVTFENYKIATAAVTWSLTGSVGFIVGKFFGESVKLADANQ